MSGSSKQWPLNKETELQIVKSNIRNKQAVCKCRFNSLYINVNIHICWKYVKIANS